MTKTQRTTSATIRFGASNSNVTVRKGSVSEVIPLPVAEPGWRFKEQRRKLNVYKGKVAAAVYEIVSI